MAQETVLIIEDEKDLIEAIGPDGELRIACEYRLMPIVKRSFPQAVVGHHMSATVEGREVRAVPKIGDGADFWTPMATPLRAFRNRIEDFPSEPGFLKADPATTEPWSGLLEQNTPGSVALTVPLLVVQGKADTLVRPEITATFVEHERSIGTKVTFITFPDIDHGLIALVAMPDVMKWLREVGA